MSRATNYLYLLPALALVPLALYLSSVSGNAPGSTNVARLSDVDWVAVTMPSARVDVGCEQDGAIASMPVTEGTAVKPGAVLFQMTTRVQELEVQRLKLLADSKMAVHRAKAELLFAEREEQRTRELHGKGMKGVAEFEDRRRAAEVKRIQLQEAQEQRQVAVLRWRQEQARLAQRTVRSTIHGHVRSILHRPGNTIQRLEPVLQLLQLQPLFVEFDCPAEDVDRVVVGETLWVRRSGDVRAVAAKVLHAAKDVDAASQTFRVRLRLDNKDMAWRSGIKVVVATKPDVPVRKGDR